MSLAQRRTQTRRLIDGCRDLLRVSKVARYALLIAATFMGVCCRIALADPPPAHWGARIVEYGPDGDVSNSLLLVPRIAIKNSVDKEPIKITPPLGTQHTFQMSADPSLKVTCSRIGRTGDKDIYRVVITSKTGAKDQVKTIELGDNRVLLWQRGSSRLIIEPKEPKEEIEQDRELAARGELPAPAFPHAALVNYGRNGRWKSIMDLGPVDSPKSESKPSPFRFSFKINHLVMGTAITREGKPPLKVRFERWGRKGNKDVYRFEFSSESQPPEKVLIELGDKPVLVLDEPDNRLMLEPTPPNAQR
jgi:hypothetical protein